MVIQSHVCCYYHPPNDIPFCFHLTEVYTITPQTSGNACLHHLELVYKRLSTTHIHLVSACQHISGTTKHPATFPKAGQMADISV